RVCTRPGPSVVMCASLSPPAAPGDLPSFPTRRSSDLITCYDAAHQAQVQEALTARGVPLDQVGFVLCPSNDVWARDHGPLTVYQDRKSTRLNSSHVKISYAVFCLKKKNHKNNQ